MRKAIFGALGLLHLALSVPVLQGQVEIGARAASIRVGGRLHAQYGASSVSAAEADFFLRRVRLTADVTLSDFVSGRIQPDFARGAVALQDTYVTLGFSDAFELSLGQFKRAFDLFELSSSTDLSLVERDGRIEGLDVCSGVGSICSYSVLTEELAYAERDQGIRVSGSRERVGYSLTVTNGTGINVSDENDTKSFSGRVTLAANERVSVSGQVGLHDWVDPAAENRYGVAVGADVEVGTWRDGLHLQASAVRGDNWMVLDPGLDPAAFLALQAVATYYRPLQGDRIVGIEPLARLSWGDPVTGTAGDGGLLLTPGLMLYFGGRSKIGANVDVYAPQTGSTEYSLKLQTFLYF